MTYGRNIWMDLLEVLGVLLIIGFCASAVVVGAIPFTQCEFHSFLDCWLIVFGVTGAAVIVGLAIWRSEANICSFINGPKYLFFLLLALNIIWLIIGNVLVFLYYASCNTLTEFNMVRVFNLTCDFYILPFVLAVVLVADFIYIVVLMAYFCKMDCCNDCSCWWCRDSCWTIYLAIIVGVTIFVILAIIAIGFGATYLQECVNENFDPLWLIILGVGLISAVLVITFWVRCQHRLADSWATPKLVIPLPILVFAIFISAVITRGNIWLVATRAVNCAGFSEDLTCNSTLRLFTIVTVILVDFPLFVIFYVGAVLLIIIKFFFFMSCCYYCSNDLEGCCCCEKKCCIKKDCCECCCKSLCCEKKRCEREKCCEKDCCEEKCCDNDCCVVTDCC